MDLAIDHEIHTWSIDLDRPPPDDSLLSAEERGRRARFVQPIDRARFTAARACVREILGRYLGVAPGGLVFAANEFRKLHLVTSDQYTLSFNLSHSTGRALLAIAAGRVVGVDIEIVRSIDDLADMAKQIMSDSELADFQRHLAQPAASTTAQRTFFDLWVRKEAILKAIGSGFLIDPRTVDVGTSPGAARVSQGNSVWSVLPLDVGGLPKRRSRRPAGFRQYDASLCRHP